MKKVLHDEATPPPGLRKTKLGGTGLAKAVRHAASTRRLLRPYGRRKWPAQRAAGEGSSGDTSLAAGDPARVRLVYLQSRRGSGHSGPVAKELVGQPAGSPSQRAGRHSKHRSVDAH